MDKLLERGRRAVLELALHGQVRPELEGTFALQLAPQRQPSIPPQVQVRCRPITWRGDQAVVLANGCGERQPVQFDGLSRQALTTFFAFRLSAQVEGQTAALSFVLNLPLAGLPPDREACIIKDILNDTGKLLRLILLLLQDSGDDMAGYIDALEAGVSKNEGHPWQVAGIPLFETMVRALHRDPSRIDAVAELLDRLRLDGEAARLLPADFDQIWQPVLPARQALAQEGQRNGRH